MTPEQRKLVSELSQSLNQLQNIFAEHVKTFDSQIKAISGAGLGISEKDAVKDYIHVKNQFAEAIKLTAMTINEMISK